MDGMCGANYGGVLERLWLNSWSEFGGAFCLKLWGFPATLAPALLPQTLGFWSEFGGVFLPHTLGFWSQVGWDLWSHFWWGFGANVVEFLEQVWQ